MIMSRGWCMTGLWGTSTIRPIGNVSFWIATLLLVLIASGCQKAFRTSGTFVGRAEGQSVLDNRSNQYEVVKVVVLPEVNEVESGLGDGISITQPIHAILVDQNYMTFDPDQFLGLGKLVEAEGVLEASVYGPPELSQASGLGEVSGFPRTTSGDGGEVERMILRIDRPAIQAYNKGEPTPESAPNTSDS